MHQNDTQIKIIKQLQEKYDDELFEQLFVAYLPYIKRVSYRFKSYDLSQEDLIQIGCWELYLSILSYDYNIQPIFFAYFKSRLINAIRTHLRPYLTQKRGYGMVKVPLDAPMNDENGNTSLIEYIKSDSLMPEDFLMIQDKQEAYYSMLSGAEITSLLYGMSEYRSEVLQFFDYNRDAIKNAKSRARRKYRRIDDKYEMKSNTEDNRVE